ncbi:MAG: ADP-glyceromanno-heptose 6-epimerase [Gammaproteobacteria bacterium]|nr:ADP-glyceromanno-heptose 6-epimerase [Gammaproteobacteria bacterium]
MIIVTGGAGFIGSYMVKMLNQKGINNIMLVDELNKDAEQKFFNLIDRETTDYMDKDDFLEHVKIFGLPEGTTSVIHMGACSATTEWDGQFIMRNNFEYTKTLFHACEDIGASFIYASSASVYGMGPVFKEHRNHEKPMNMYAYSKFLFDQYLREIMPEVKIQVVGLRYFNVYGPGEQHKGDMASVAYKLNTQIPETGKCQLFEGADGYGNGGQLRDFVYVEDVCKVKLWLLDNPQISGIFNLGTGKAQSFKDVADAVIDYHHKGEIEYIPFPDHLIGRYQSYTQADITALRDAGYTEPFKTVEEGVKAYMQWLNKG